MLGMNIELTLRNLMVNIGVQQIILSHDMKTGQRYKKFIADVSLLYSEISSERYKIITGYMYKYVYTIHFFKTSAMD